MFCRKCGAANDDNAINCQACGALLNASAPPPPQGEALPRNVPNYLVQAILVTIFCCLPFGIPAIVYAAQVNGKLEAGDLGGAIAASEKARMWCWVAFGVGLAITLAYIPLVLISGL